MGDPRHDLGLRAEDAVAAWLTAAAWRVLARRWRCRQGELDLVCLDPSGSLVGVEVRARRTMRAGDPAESVDRRRLARLRSALIAYAAASGIPHRGLRIDLVAAVPAPGDELGRWRLQRLPALEGW